MERLLRLFALVLSGVLLLGCAGGGPTVDYDPRTDITTYTSFNVARGEKASVDPLNAGRIENAIVRNLTAKGYRFDNGGEFTALYDIRIAKDVPSNFSFGFGFGGWGHHGGGTIGTSVTPTSDKAVIRIDMIDAKSHKVFWSASTTETMPDFTTPRSRESFFNGVVDQLLADFPKRRKGV